MVVVAWISRMQSVGESFPTGFFKRRTYLFILHRWLDHLIYLICHCPQWGLVRVTQSLSGSLVLVLKPC